jgi:hypothetical protein
LKDAYPQRDIIQVISKKWIDQVRVLNDGIAHSWERR